MKEHLKSALAAIAILVAAGRDGHHRGWVVGMSLGYGADDQDDGRCASTPTLAALATLSGHHGERVYCDETQSTYRFDESATQSDGFVYVSPQVGAGAWVHQGDDLHLSAIDGQSDDWPRLFAALTATAGARKRLVMMGGVTWICDTAPGQGALAEVLVPSFARLHCQPDVLIRTTLTPTPNPGGYAASPFLALAQGLGSGASLTASTPQGATVLSVAMTAGVLHPNDWIVIEGGPITNVGEVRRIVSISGSGSPSYTLKLDEPLDLAWTAPGAYVTGVSVATDIDLDFNGAEISGTGDRAIELGAVMHSTVRNLRVTTRFGSLSWGGSFDIGGHDNTWQGCSADGAGVVGFALENNRGSRILDSVAKNGAGVGFYLPDCYGCELRGGATEGNNIGVWLGAGGADDPLGAIDSRVSGLRAIGNTSFGILADSVTDLMISDTTVSGGGDGIVIAPAVSSTPHDAKLRNIAIHDTASFGLVVENATLEAQGLNVDRAGNYSIYTAGASAVVKLSQLGVSQTVLGNGPWYVDGGSKLWLRDFTVDAQLDGTWIGVLASSASEIRLENGTFAAGGTGLKAILDMEEGGALHIDRVSASGTGWSYGVFAAHENGARVYRGKMVDLSASAIPWAFDGKAFANFGTVKANGATPVVLGTPAPLFGKGQTMVFSAQSLAGGPGAIISLPPENGVTRVQSSAGDLSTYTWYVAD